VKVAAVQHDIVWCDRRANFERLEPRIAAAADAGARLVVLSETFSTGFAVGSDDFAEPEDGPSSEFLRATASRHDIWLAGSCPEIPSDSSPDDRRPANTLVLAGPSGETYRYRKIHPFTFGGEDRHVRPGSDLVTVRVDDLRVSLFVCYDLRFADEFWQLANDTDLYLVPANWPASRREHWSTLLRARAIENQAYVIGCNRVGEGGGLSYSGDSVIVDPFGELLAEGPAEECTLFAEIAPERVAEVRDRYRFLPDRR
jgi:predicted amidohydrolase